MNRMKILLITFSLVFLLMVPVNAFDSEVILENIYEKMSLHDGSYIMDLEVISYNDEESNEANIRVYLYDKERSVVAFLSPERLMDNKYLVISNNTWIYEEGLMRPIRISPRQKLFGEAGIAETAGIDYCQDYIISSKNENEEQYILELEARDENTAYQQAKLWISKDEVQINRVLLRALNGQPLKELIYTNYQDINGHQLAEVEIRNLLYEKEKKTVLRFTGVRDKDLPAEAFHPLMLSKFKLLVRDEEMLINE